MLKGTVLIPIDFSKTSEKLLTSISELKEHGIDSVLLVHVVDPTNTGINPHTLRRYHEERLKNLQTNIEPLIDKIEIKVMIGRGSKKIVELAEEEEVALILIASHGRGLIKRILLGGTVYNVIRRSSRPVLVEKFKDIEKDEDIKLATSSKFDKILLPTDLSTFSNQVLAQIIKSRSHFNEIILVNIVEGSKDPGFLEPQKINDTLNNITEKLKENNICKKATIKTREGMASREILKIADQENASLIMMATRGTGNIQRLLIGSTADRVVRRSNIPVLLFPFHQDSKD